jgi:hypothetical protein
LCVLPNWSTNDENKDLHHPAIILARSTYWCFCSDISDKI